MRIPFSVVGFLPFEYLAEYGDLDDNIPEQAERMAELEEMARDAYEALLEDKYDD